MKQYMVLALVLIASAALAQPPGGRKFELGLSGGYENYSTGSSGSSTSLFIASPRFGYFLYEGLEIEGELMAAFPSVGDAAYQISGNLSYNFPMQSHALGFILAGYGVGNTIPMFGVPGLSYGSGSALHVLNLGAGLKVLAAENVAIRVEGRYRKYGGTRQAYYGTIAYPEVDSTIDMRIFSVMFGLSLFF
jgi:opacity protein-like surface antigen